MRLQEYDLRLDALRAEVAALPKQIAEIERALEAHTRKLEIEKATLAANLKSRRDHEQKIQGFEQKKSHLKNQMMEARTNEQYWAFQKEISYLDNEIGEAETKILELMEAAEPLQDRVRKAEGDLAEERKSVEAEKAVARDRSAADEKEIAAVSGEREKAAKEISKPVYQTYERLRQRPRGLAVAECVGDLCSACHIALRPQFLQDLRRGDQVLYCENCGRLLYLEPAPIVVEP